MAREYLTGALAAATAKALVSSSVAGLESRRQLPTAFQTVAALTVDGAGALPQFVLPQALAIGYLGLVVTTGSFVASNMALARLGVERAALFNGLAPLIALLSTAAVGTTTFTLPRAAGAVLVALGSASG